MEFKILLILLLTFQLIVATPSFIGWEEAKDDNITGWTFDKEKNQALINLNEEVENPITVAYMECSDCPDAPTIGQIIGTNSDQLKLSVEKDVVGKWKIVVNSKMDFEVLQTNNKFYCNIELEKSDIKPSVFIIINNIDDNPPQITDINESRRCNFKENNKGATKCEFTIYDKDGKISTDKMTVSIANGSPNDIEDKLKPDLVIVDDYNKKLTLKVIKPLDFETTPVYFFSLVAHDTKQDSIAFPVVFSIEDLPDEEPRWTNIFATKTFEEEKAQTFTVRAEDGDRGVNSPIKYKLEIEDEASTYNLDIKINEDTGIISVANIDRDKHNLDFIKIKITATEQNDQEKYPNAENMFKAEEVTFIITDINDNCPNIALNKSEISIPENTIMILPVEITMEDIDSGANAKSDLIIKDKLSGRELLKYSEAFQAIPKTGFQKWTSQISIVDTENLDYDQHPESRKFTIQLYGKDDFDGQGNVADLEISLINRNDEIPVFTEDTYTFKNIKENVPAKYSIGTVAAKDADYGDNVEYSIVSDSFKKSFEINKDTGEIKTNIAKALDYETTKEISIQIQAKDTLIVKDFPQDKLHTVFTQVIIQVKDVNDVPPKITVENEFEDIEENLKEGTNIVDAKTTVKITAEDPDTDADLDFSIDWSASYATKQGARADSKWYTECLKISTTKQDQPGVKSAFATLTVQQLAVKDNNGNLITLDYEKYEYIYLSIVVTDKNTVENKKTDTVKITIPIADLNDNSPKFIDSTIQEKKSVTETDDEGTPEKLIIGSIAATDADGPKYNNVKYSMRAVNADSENKVQITENGQLFVDKGVVIDADTKKLKEYLYKVTACDGKTTDLCDGNKETGALGSSVQISVTITDTNNKSPELKDSCKLVDVEVPEDELMKELQTIIGEDADRDEPYNVVAYYIDNDKMDPNVAKFFEIGTKDGKVSLHCPGEKSCLERDGPNGYQKITVHIQLRDMNGIGNYKTNRNPIQFNVILKDVNDNAPVLQKKTLESREENYDKDKPIGTIEAIDIDEGDNSKIEYYFTNIYRTDPDKLSTEIIQDHETTEDKKIFNIDPDKGDITTKQILRGYYGDIILEVEAKDHGKPPLTGDKLNYTFEVTKYNFEVPSFLFPDQKDPQPIVLLKDQDDLNNLRTVTGSRLEKINATDNQNDKYAIHFEILEQKSIEDGNVGNEVNLFGITEGGEMATIATLKMLHNLAENDPMRYKVTFGCSHNGVGAKNSSQVTVDVQLTDPEQEPYFDYDNFLTHEFVEEDSKQKFTPKPAYDVKQQKIYYFLNEGDEKFVVNKDDGTLGLNKALDREIEEHYTVEIICTSSMEKPNKAKNPKSILHINITVKDINDNPPEFTSKLYPVGVSEKDEPYRTIITLKATDPDSSDEGNLKFSMIPGTITVSDSSLQDLVGKDPFNVTNEGNVYNQFKATESMKGYFQFDVQVEDSPPQSHKASAQVKVSIISDASRVLFQFKNTVDEIEEHSVQIEKIFSSVFKLNCVIDDISTDTESSGVTINGQTKIKTHFMRNDEAVPQDEIKRLAQNVDNIIELRTQLNIIGLNLLDLKGIDNQGTGDLEEKLKMLQIILIVVAVILTTICVALLIGCILKIRSLNHRLDTLTLPTAFGSNHSGLNRIGAGNSAPGTNRHAVEANPVWNTGYTGDQLDNISQGSGDSDLIGVEDNIDFEDRRKTVNPVKNPFAHINLTLETKDPKKEKSDDALDDDVINTDIFS